MSDATRSGVLPKLAIVLIVAGAAGAVIYLKQQQAQEISITSETELNIGQGLPSLIEFGRGQCAACKAMKPVIEGMASDFKDSLNVQNVDTGANPQLAGKFKIRIIPCQIFFDANGREIFRHEGFFDREKILARWKELGFDLEAKPSAPPASADTQKAPSCSNCSDH
jgi:thioredoxin 1